MDTVTLTREELHALVWSEPMTAVAEEFGVSSVAFAKHCVKLGVPRPSRGYWQQRAAGLKPRPDKLPKPGPGTPTEIELVRHERSERKVRELPDAPLVVVGDKLMRPHSVVKQIRERTRPLRPNGHGMSGVRGEGHAVFKVGPKTERRALLLLDALLKALVNRGHQVELQTRSDLHRDRSALHVLINQEPIEFWLTEHANRAEHVPTAKEQADHAKYGWSFASKFDFTPSGQLILEAHRAWDEGLRHSWADAPKQRLEDLLGEIVVGLEAIAVALTEQRRQREVERLAEERRREAEELERRRAEKRRALTKHLVESATRWREAQTTREFLSALGKRVPKRSRSAKFEAWLAWATEYVERHDPLGLPDSIAQTLEPDPAS